MELISKEEIDILGEIANISMGNAATALSIMLNRRVDITTPRISVINRSESLDDYEKTCIFVQIHYVKGLSGNNVLILKEHDVLSMTDMMMGGDGTNPDPEVNEMHLSAASEAMNQMMGKAATSMATLYDTMVDISTPDVHKIDVESVKTFEKMFESNSEKFIKISFRIEVSDVIDSTMVQLYPVSFAMEMVEKFRQRKAAGAIGKE
ncbi:flagellar motor switch phosphatase FliY [[Clostridium] aminophilum]|uniref:flagellar motor switch phosphatase FliY n=1 Tax=[Clostridium] aminophilum TaxID=1526 RepID=UPI0026F25B55|nr:flagellar motor switch phosphatase FliY [[Clostridium] aminophilum]MDD6195826.1 flagellar motor switch phosphatase FliY [[Clostridium] aminophilum]